MSSLHYAMLVLLIGNVVSATNTTQGCKLNIPKDVQGHMEVQGKPLEIAILMKIIRVRDVPDSGGAFGVDLM